MSPKTTPRAARSRAAPAGRWAAVGGASGGELAVSAPALLAAVVRSVTGMAPGLGEWGTSSQASEDRPVWARSPRTGHGGRQGYRPHMGTAAHRGGERYARPVRPRIPRACRPEITRRRPSAPGRSVRGDATDPARG